ncbi:hypothetical protein [Massilia psychrophila]|jgi:hypothetical protein|uniref:Uncharacterized protein n=1 Tax=Massilia psychrophila TaxID=1603353 RepID=A0A2G8T2I7_9BURK|nr:hypothetical protein [Massilia psychrophila]PIL40229.1 hypothetical protein CR103_08570 [Massilia psychrophila]GGE76071.1 hypothetical protein GCM10008020_20930 [Massilia psychrophila]
MKHLDTVKLILGDPLGVATAPSGADFLPPGSVPPGSVPKTGSTAVIGVIVTVGSLATIVLEMRQS